jgi:flagellar biosynthesis protein FliR
MVSTLVLGLVGRAVPQINIMAVGVGLNTLMLLGLSCLTLGVVAWTFQQPLVDVLVQLRNAVHP